MNINIDLTEREAHFLKEFANKHYPGAKDNLITYNPIHLVEDEWYIYTNSDDNFDNDGELVICSDCEEYDNLREFIKIEFGDYLDEDDKLENVPEEIDIWKTDDIIDDFCKKYTIKIEYSIVKRVSYYHPVAFFFIREEAKKYLKYQSHNLKRPRIYTYSPGYSNQGGYNEMWNVLFKIGENLNGVKKSKLEEETKSYV